VDILVNMAGVLLRGPLGRIKPGDWKWMLDTNLLGAVRTTMAFLPHLTERGSGHIINTVSAGALAPRDPLTIAYDTGEVALASFTKSLASAVSGTGVNVSLFCTGTAGPRIGQNTRSRGLGRLLRPTEDLEEGAEPSEQLIDSLVDGLHNPRFLILADPNTTVPSIEPITVAS
jgi:NADP-dependent 3-hydroxy acid dehydrogenase YdfG